jgi:hypothetical protein
MIGQYFEKRVQKAFQVSALSPASLVLRVPCVRYCLVPSAVIGPNLLEDSRGLTFGKRYGKHRGMNRRRAWYPHH